MIVQSTPALLFADAVARSPSTRHFADASPRSPSARQIPAASPANIADTVRISQAAREALAASAASTASTSSTASNSDKRLAEISAKPHNTLTADEVDYLQKAAGFVNTFANLSPAEKALYDRAVASGNTDAAEGIAQIALIRQGGEMAGGADGSTYNPRTTEITASNIEKYFRHSIVDPSGKAASRFQSLIQFMQDNPVA